MAQITKDTIIGDILDMDKTTAPFFLEMGMHCLGCPASRGESLEQACMVHGVNAVSYTPLQRDDRMDQFRLCQAECIRFDT